MKKILIFLLLFLGTLTQALARDSVIVPIGNSATLGPTNAPVVMFEFLDFQ